VLLLCGVVCSYEQGVLWDVVVSKGDLAICCGLLLIVVAAGCCCLIVWLWVVIDGYGRCLVVALL
jgi:hypothetical protein